ncbi:hypothetical protein ACQR1I_27430 [Bradyrhizobium sp. HKCCYLS2038]|uniref:hypothetical protein n=1 Tax=unclassified Bradyrhizobium TaxID=2631580 RepID=UPI003EBD7FC2
MKEHDIPITPAQAYDGDYWRERARELRAKADEYDSQRRRLTVAASDFDKLAIRADAIQHEIEKLSRT